MRSQIVAREDDPVDVSYPHLRVCRTDPNLVVLFFGPGRGMMVTKAMFDDRPLFVERNDWNDDAFDFFEEAVVIQNY